MRRRLSKQQARKGLLTVRLSIQSDARTDGLDGCQRSPGQRAVCGTSSNYIDWATLMRRLSESMCLNVRSAGIDACVAVDFKREVVDKILAHVRLPVDPQTLKNGCTLDSS